MVLVPTAQVGQQPMMQLPPTPLRVGDCCDLLTLRCFLVVLVDSAWVKWVEVVLVAVYEDAAVLVVHAPIDMIIKRVGIV
jgi:hypothetical protein